MRIDFHGSPEPTLGVEWELALVDRRSRDLRNDATHLFARAKPRLADPGRLHFAAHSHHLWPDASYDGQVACWEDAARLADRKWDRVIREAHIATQ